MPSSMLPSGRPTPMKRHRLVPTERRRPLQRIRPSFVSARPERLRDGQAIQTFHDPATSSRSTGPDGSNVIAFCQVRSIRSGQWRRGRSRSCGLATTATSLVDGTARHRGLVPALEPDATGAERIVGVRQHLDDPAKPPTPLSQARQLGGPDTEPSERAHTNRPGQPHPPRFESTRPFPRNGRGDGRQDVNRDGRTLNDERSRVASARTSTSAELTDTADGRHNRSLPTGQRFQIQVDPVSTGVPL